MSAKKRGQRPLLGPNDLGKIIMVHLTPGKSIMTYLLILAQQFKEASGANTGRSHNKAEDLNFALTFLYSRVFSSPWDISL